MQGKGQSSAPPRPGARGRGVCVWQNQHNSSREQVADLPFIHKILKFQTEHSTGQFWRRLQIHVKTEEKPGFLLQPYSPPAPSPQTSGQHCPSPATGGQGWGAGSCLWGHPSELLDSQKHTQNWGPVSALPLTCLVTEQITVSLWALVHPPVRWGGSQGLWDPFP